MLALDAGPSEALSGRVPSSLFFDLDAIYILSAVMGSSSSLEVNTYGTDATSL